MPLSAQIQIPAQQNILQYTADFIFKRFSSELPDLSNLFVLLPSSQLAQPFNESLHHCLSSEIAAIIPPWSGSLKSWTLQFAENQQANFELISEHARQLLFIEALQQYPDLFKEKNQWQVSQALLAFFDELKLNQKDIFHSAEQWQQQLTQAYGSQQHNFEHLANESKLVYTLWHAWQIQLSENNLYDETADYISRLSHAANTLDKRQQFICLNPVDYSITEQLFLEKLIASQQCHVIAYTSTLRDDNESVNESADEKNISDADKVSGIFIREVYRQIETPIKQRAQNFAAQYGDIFSAQMPFSTYLASDEEQQIRAIDYFVRSKILQGKKNIVVISEDRKLSRRLRAVLERANIQLQDRAGWSLATTQAATVIERWLECIEEDFSAYPLLDCLKSPFLSLALEHPQTSTDFKQNIYRFEHDLVFFENTSSNIEKYKKALKRRLKRLTHWPENSYSGLIETLDFINDSASPLANLYHQKTKIPLSDFLQKVLDSLQQLGVLHAYQSDEAGLVLLRTFESLRQALAVADPILHWQDCRTWLGMALESQNFTPPTKHSVVQLMTLEQSACCHFDCVVIAATESQHFPGSAKNTPFFNQAVRAALALDTWEKQRQQRHELFNQLLLCSPEVLFTACNEDKGEARPVSPWLELLTSFYQLAFTDSLENQPLKRLMQSKSEVFNCDDITLPPASLQATSAIPEDLIPQRLSASSYQRLINCPYQYFSADALKLKALEELSDELKKSTYGERIHTILQTFHSGHDIYGKAFAGEISSDNRQPAIETLIKISERVFVRDLDNNTLHRSWLYRWKKHIPNYIDWQMQQQFDWRFFQSEQQLETELAVIEEPEAEQHENERDGSIKIYGRLDRIDQHKTNHSHAVIDYKTGKTARQEDIDNGENVQLSTYALLDEKASEVSYLSVDSAQQKVESRSCLSGAALDENRALNKQRLSQMFQQIKEHAELPAWGDDTVCRFCHFSGLCRKAEWLD